MKKQLLFFSLAVLVFSGLVFTSPAQAHGCQGSECAMKSHGSKYGCPIAEKFFKKAHYLLEHQQDLGLNEQQVSDIKVLKHEAKRALIKNMASHQIFSLDLKQKLSEPKIDMPATSALIDNQASAMAAAAKDAVASYAKLTAILTPDQVKKIKELWLAHEAKEHQD